MASIDFVLCYKLTNIHSNGMILKFSK